MAVVGVSGVDLVAVGSVLSHGRQAGEGEAGWRILDEGIGGGVLGFWMAVVLSLYL